MVNKKNLKKKETNMISIAINGFGRIGRTFLRTILQDSASLEKIKISAINIGPADINSTAHMFKYDTIMGTFPGQVIMEKDNLIIGKNIIKIVAESDPANINWLKLDVELVIDCTGHFTDANLAKLHLKSGAKYVLISAPAKNEDITIIPGVNDQEFDKNKHKIISLGSCTTNALLPILKTIHDEFIITSGFLTTTHAYTNSQVLLDVEKKDLRRGRAAAQNIIPTSTGAAKLVGKIIPGLKNIFEGCAIRIPLDIVSLVDISFVSKKTISPELINNAFEQAKNDVLKNILDITMQPLVSSDFKGISYSVTVDGLLTQTSGQMGKVFGWYDNEWGYSCRLRDFIKIKMAR